MPTPGYITLQFNATYLGDYRICWRLNAGPYTCFTVNCGSIGSCTVYITPISFATNVCETDNYNGYVQAACEDPNTLDGAVMWDVDYAALQSCVPWEYSCQGTTSSSTFSIDVQSSGIVGFNPVNAIAGDLDCLCNSNRLGPPFLRSAGPNVNWNTNLTISPWVSGDLTQIFAYNTGTGAVGAFNWTPGKIFCGRFFGCWNVPLSVNSDPSDITPDGCTGASTNFGNLCLYKPILTLSAPPPGGVQATAELVIGLGGLPNGTVLTNFFAGTGGTPGTYYAWNIQQTGSTSQPAICPTPRGRGYFQVVVGSTGQVTSVTSCNNMNCDPTQPAVYGYGFRGNVTELVEFDPNTIGGVQAGIFRTPNSTGTDLGTILDVVITNPGSGYTSVPTITISAPSCGGNIGNLPFVSPVLVLTGGGGVAPCPSFIPNLACGNYPNNIYPTVPSMPVGTTFNICYPNNTTPPPATGWDIQKDNDGCCYDCVNILITTTPANPNPKVVYTDCDGSIIRVETITSSPFAINCAVNDSWASDATDTTFQVLGPC